MIIIIIATFVILFIKNIGKQGQENSTIQSSQTQNTQPASKKESRIKNIGVNLDYFNSNTNQAGDLFFFKIKKPYDRIFVDFGHIVAAENTFDNKESTNLHPTFILPLGTKIMALIDGVVVDVPKLYSNDYSVQMSEDGQRNSLIFEVEHVKNPIVKAGDPVKAGQIIAEVTDFGSHNYPGYGSVDIAVFKTKNDSQPQHLCPFLYLDDSIKEDVFKKIRALYVSWEKYIGDETLYNENSYNTPGCLIVDPIDG